MEWQCTDESSKTKAAANNTELALLEATRQKHNAITTETTNEQHPIDASWSKCNPVSPILCTREAAAALAGMWKAVAAPATVVP